MRASMARWVDEHHQEKTIRVCVSLSNGESNRKPLLDLNTRCTLEYCRTFNDRYTTWIPLVENQIAMDTYMPKAR